MLERRAKQHSWPVARASFQKLARSPSTWWAPALSLGTFGLLLALPLPIGDRQAALLGAAASSQLLLVSVILFRVLLLSRTPARANNLGVGAALCAEWVGHSLYSVALIGLLVVSQLLALAVFTGLSGPLVLRLWAHACAFALVSLAWAQLLGRRFGPFAGTLGLLILLLAASGLAEIAARQPGLVFLPDFALLSPVGHALDGPPLLELCAYTLLQAGLPLALAATLAHVDAARGRRAVE